MIGRKRLRTPKKALKKHLPTDRQTISGCQLEVRLDEAIAYSCICLMTFLCRLDRMLSSSAGMIFFHRPFVHSFLLNAGKIHRYWWERPKGTRTQRDLIGDISLLEMWIGSCPQRQHKKKSGVCAYPWKCSKSTKFEWHTQVIWHPSIPSFFVIVLSTRLWAQLPFFAFRLFLFPLILSCSAPLTSPILAFRLAAHPL